MKQQNLRSYLSNTISAVSETMQNQPLVEIVGRHRVLVENHRGVCAYTTDKVNVLVRYGQLEILGDDLSLSYMSGNQLVISGKIRCILLTGGE